MDFTKIFGQMGQFQSQMENLHKQMAELRVTKETGAGLVKVTMNGEKKLLMLAINDTILNAQDKDMVQDLIIAALNAALEEVDHKIQSVVQNNIALGSI